ncbi:MAG: hypothetical protein WCD18_16295 [Thermosynechococcaceae cyanobacterium]
MRTRYCIAVTLAFVLSLMPMAWRPVIAAMPADIQACLKPADYMSTPSQYREITRMKSGSTLLYYLHVFYKGDTLPSNQTLIAVKDGRCKTLTPDTNPLITLSKYVSRDIAFVLTEKKWRSLIQIPAGLELAKSFGKVKPKLVQNEMGEALDSPQLPPEDIAALRKLGFVVR